MYAAVFRVSRQPVKLDADGGVRLAAGGLSILDRLRQLKKSLCAEKEALDEFDDDEYELLLEIENTKLPEVERMLQSFDCHTPLITADEGDFDVIGLATALGQAMRLLVALGDGCSVTEGQRPEDDLLCLAQSFVARSMMGHEEKDQYFATLGRMQMPLPL